MIKASPKIVFDEGVIQTDTLVSLSQQAYSFFTSEPVLGNLPSLYRSVRIGQQILKVSIESDSLNSLITGVVRISNVPVEEEEEEEEDLFVTCLLNPNITLFPPQPYQSLKSQLIFSVSDENALKTVELNDVGSVFPDKKAGNIDWRNSLTDATDLISWQGPYNRVKGRSSFVRQFPSINLSGSVTKTISGEVVISSDRWSGFIFCEGESISCPDLVIGAGVTNGIKVCVTFNHSDPTYDNDEIYTYDGTSWTLLQTINYTVPGFITLSRNTPAFISPDGNKIVLTIERYEIATKQVTRDYFVYSVLSSSPFSTYTFSSSESTNNRFTITDTSVRGAVINHAGSQYSGVLDRTLDVSPVSYIICKDWITDALGDIVLGALIQKRASLSISNTETRSVTSAGAGVAKDYTLDVVDYTYEYSFEIDGIEVYSEDVDFKYSLSHSTNTTTQDVDKIEVKDSYRHISFNISYCDLRFGLLYISRTKGSYKSTVDTSVSSGTGTSSNNITEGAYDKEMYSIIQEDLVSLYSFSDSGGSRLVSSAADIFNSNILGFNSTVSPAAPGTTITVSTYSDWTSSFQERYNASDIYSRDVLIPGLNEEKMDMARIAVGRKGDVAYYINFTPTSPIALEKNFLSATTYHFPESGNSDGLSVDSENIYPGRNSDIYEQFTISQLFFVGGVSPGPLGLTDPHSSDLEESSSGIYHVFNGITFHDSTSLVDDLYDTHSTLGFPMFPLSPTGYDRQIFGNYYRANQFLDHTTADIGICVL